MGNLLRPLFFRGERDLSHRLHYPSIVFELLISKILSAGLGKHSPGHLQSTASQSKCAQRWATWGLTKATLLRLLSFCCLNESHFDRGGPILILSIKQIQAARCNIFLREEICYCKGILTESWHFACYCDVGFEDKSILARTPPSENPTFDFPDLQLGELSENEMGRRSSIFRRPEASKTGRQERDSPDSVIILGGSS